MHTTPDALKLKHKFMRPASLEIRYATKDEYEQAVALYLDTLNTTEVNEGKTFCSFRLGDSELLLTQDASPAGYNNRTIVYWEVDDLTEVYDDLKNNKKFKSLEPPHPGQQVPGQRPTERALLKDDAGNLLGLIINPPYPFVEM